MTRSVSWLMALVLALGTFLVGAADAQTGRSLRPINNIPFPTLRRTVETFPVYDLCTVVPILSDSTTGPPHNIPTVVVQGTFYANNQSSIARDQPAMRYQVFNVDTDASASYIFPPYDAAGHPSVGSIALWKTDFRKMVVTIIPVGVLCRDISTTPAPVLGNLE